MKKWYDIKAKASPDGPKTAEIFVYGDIGESWYGDTVTATQFVRDIAAIDAESITVRLNSYGGSVSDGIAIYNALRRHPASITTTVDGVALSIASLIAMAGDEIEIAENAMMMIHAPWGGVMGNSTEMREYADILDKMAGAMATSYAVKSGKSMDDILALLTDGEDHWYTADEAVAEGFATRTTAALAIAASAQDIARPDFWAARKASKATASAVVAEIPVAVAAINSPKGNAMTEVTTLAAAPDEPAILARINARNRELIDTGKAYAKFGGEALAMQAVSEGWTAEQLNAKLLAAVSSGPAHAAYGQGARAESNENPATLGFRNMGEFAQAVKAAATQGNGKMDPRLQAAATTYGNEGTNSEGGFAVPPEWRSEILKLVSAEESLLAMTDQQFTASNSMTFPVDESTAWQSSGGILAYWTGEAVTMTGSKPALKANTVRLDKLSVLVPVTDELLEDAASMGTYVSGKAAEKINYKVNAALISGTGVGQPLGILNASCLVSIAKETSQAASTILAANVLKMWARMPAMNRRRAVWLVNQDVESQLMQMNIDTKNVAGSENVSGMPAFLPPGGLSGSPYATLLGRPIIPTEACSALSSKGDIILADLGSYLTVTKSSGLRSDSSVHLYFDQDVTAFRFILRMGGQPWLSTYITPANGTNYRSHFVTLDAR